MGHGQLCDSACWRLSWIFDFHPAIEKFRLIASRGMSVAITTLFAFFGLLPPERIRWSDPVIEDANWELQANVFINMPKLMRYIGDNASYQGASLRGTAAPTPYTALSGNHG